MFLWRNKENINTFGLKKNHIKCYVIDLLMCQNCWISGNNVYSDHAPRSAAPDLGLYCLFRPVCLNTSG